MCIGVWSAGEVDRCQDRHCPLTSLDTQQSQLSSSVRAILGAPWGPTSGEKGGMPESQPTTDTTSPALPTRPLSLDSVVAVPDMDVRMSVDGPSANHQPPLQSFPATKSNDPRQYLAAYTQSIQQYRQLFFQRALATPSQSYSLSKTPFQSQQSRLREAINSLTPPKKILLFPEQCALPVGFSRKYVCTEELGAGGCGFALVCRRLEDWRPFCVKFVYKNRVSAQSWVLDTLSPDGTARTETVSASPQSGKDRGVHWDSENADASHGGASSSRSILHPATEDRSNEDAVMEVEEKKVAVPLEVYLLRHLKHDNIVGFADVWEDPRHFVLVMELHGCPWDANSKQRVPSFDGGYPVLSRTGPTAAVSPPKSSVVDGATSLPANFSPCPCQLPPPVQYAPPLPSTIVPQHPSTDLFECVEKLGVLTEQQARHVFRQVVEAVWYLHVVCGVVHRDIKDENLVVSHDLTVKLIDLGNSAFAPPKDRPDLFFDRFYGTVQYCAPEVLVGKKYRGPEAEMWSLGILLYTLLFSELPFADPSQTVHLRYARPRYQRSPAALALLDRLLEKDPARRATVDEVKGCSWWGERL